MRRKTYVRARVELHSRRVSAESRTGLSQPQLLVRYQLAQRSRELMQARSHRKRDMSRCKQIAPPNSSDVSLLVRRRWPRVCIPRTKPVKTVKAVPRPGSSIHDPVLERAAESTNATSAHLACGLTAFAAFTGFRSAIGGLSAPLEATYGTERGKTLLPNSAIVQRSAKLGGRKAKSVAA